MPRTRDLEEPEEMEIAQFLCWQTWCQLLKGNAEKLTGISINCCWGTHWQDWTEITFSVQPDLYKGYCLAFEEGEVVLRDGPVSKKKTKVLARFPYCDPNQPMAKYLKKHFGLALLDRHLSKTLPPGWAAPRL